MTNLVFLLIRLVLLVGIIFSLVYFLMIVVVPENYIFISERLGHYHKTLYSGLHLQVPFLDKVVYRVSNKEQTLLIKNLRCVTSDGHEFVIDAIFIFQIKDPVKATYETENYEIAILHEVQSHTFTEIQNHFADEIFARRYGMNQSIVKHIGEIAKNWGIKIIRFEIQQMCRVAKIA